MAEMTDAVQNRYLSFDDVENTLTKYRIVAIIIKLAAVHCSSKTKWLEIKVPAKNRQVTIFCRSLNWNDIRSNTIAIATNT